jgi:hypothetical protein
MIHIFSTDIIDLEQMESQTKKEPLTMSPIQTTEPNVQQSTQTTEPNVQQSTQTMGSNTPPLGRSSFVLMKTLVPTKVCPFIKYIICIIFSILFIC